MSVGSRPHRSPRQLAPELEQLICVCRGKTGWGPRLVAGATGFAHSTVWKVLRRVGISRPTRPAREPANSYEWPCPGDLLHMESSEYVRFQRPGHRVTGDRRSQDDNAWAYTRSRSVRQLLERHTIRHLTTKPYRPRTNGKVERFHQTMAREWAYGLTYRSHRDRAAALPHWLNHYDHNRPHSSLAGQPPSSRVHNLRGQDI